MPPYETPRPYETSRPEKEVRHTWYGWQLLLADLGSFLLLASPVPQASLVTYLAAPPALHAANGPNGKLGWSLALRVGLPVAGAGLGLLSVSGGTCDDSEEPSVCALAMVVGSFLLGGIAAAIIDDSALAWKKTYDTDDEVAVVGPSAPRRTAGLAIGAGPVPFRNGGGIGVAGRF